MGCQWIHSFPFLRRLNSCYPPPIGYADRHRPRRAAAVLSHQGDVPMLTRFLFALPLLLSLLAGANAADPVKVKQKLYVTNSDGDDVTVIDTATNKAIGRIEVGLHPHGI